MPFLNCHASPSVSSRVLAIIKEITGASDLQEEADLFASGRLDSLGLVMLLLQIEKEFGLYVPITEIDRDVPLTVDFFVQRIQETHGLC